MRSNLLIVTLLVFGLTQPSYLTAQSNSNVVICANKTTGAISLRARQCTSRENRLSNISSLRGAAGATGPAGATGATGAQGIQGTQGPQGAAGTPATVCDAADVDGVCFVKMTLPMEFLAASQSCAADGADICSNSQSWVLRENGLLRNLQTWTNSFSDDDAGAWSEVNGGMPDAHVATDLYQAPCCRTLTPARSSDQTIGGVRVVFIHNNADSDWRTAATMCAAMKADLCDKSQYRILRNNSAVTVRSWSSDASDNDSGRATDAIGNMADNPAPFVTAGFACCATRTINDCPVDLTNGVCMVSVNNSGANFLNASTDCAGQGAYICSHSQSAILRDAGVITAAANWTGSGADNDGALATVAVGDGPDDPNFLTSTSGYACCR
jgi:hypothetical protein